MATSQVDVEKASMPGRISSYLRARFTAISALVPWSREWQERYRAEMRKLVRERMAQFRNLHSLSPELRLQLAPTMLRNNVRLSEIEVAAMHLFKPIKRDLLVPISLCIGLGLILGMLLDFEVLKATWFPAWMRLWLPSFNFGVDPNLWFAALLSFLFTPVVLFVPLLFRIYSDAVVRWMMLFVPVGFGTVLYLEAR